MRILKSFQKQESGATAIEYGLIAALVALAIMVGAGSLGNSMNKQFTFVANKVSNATK